jgi:hypothetical protein
MSLFRGLPRPVTGIASILLLISFPKRGKEVRKRVHFVRREGMTVLPSSVFKMQALLPLIVGTNLPDLKA